MLSELSYNIEPILLMCWMCIAPALRPSRWPVIVSRVVRVSDVQLSSTYFLIMKWSGSVGASQYKKVVTPLSGPQIPAPPWLLASKSILLSVDADPSMV